MIDRKETRKNIRRNISEIGPFSLRQFCHTFQSIREEESPSRASTPITRGSGGGGGGGGKVKRTKLGDKAGIKRKIRSYVSWE